MSRTRRILGGTTIAYAHQAAVIFIGLWLTPFFLHQVGQRELGLWLVAGQVLGYLALLELGVIAILPREIAFASGKTPGDTDTKIGALVNQVRSIVRWQVLGLSLACLAILWFLPKEWLGLRWPLALVFVAFVTLYPTRVAVAALQGLQELPFLAKTQLAGWIASTACTVGLVIAGAGLYALVLGWIVSITVPAAAALWRIRGRWQRERGRDSAEPVGAYFQRSLWVSISQIAQVLMNGSDVLVLGKMLGPAAVVPYACTGKLLTVFANHPQLLMHAAQPALSELRVSESKTRLRVVAAALAQAMLMMSGALVVIILPVNHFFVDWWVGPSQYGGGGLTVAFASMMFLRHWNISTVYTLFCFGYERQISLTALFDGLLTVVGAAFLVWKWGPIGAPLASIIAVLTVSLPFNARSVAHEMGLTVFEFMAAVSPLFLRIVAVAAFAVMASMWIQPHSFVSTGLLLLAVAALYAIAIVPLAWKGPVGPYLRMALPFLVRRNGAGPSASLA